MANSYDDARMDHFRTLPGSRRPYRSRRSHACPRPLAMEYDRLLWLVERASGLRSGASGKDGVETIPAHYQVLVEERTRHIMVKRRTSRSQILSIDHYHLTCVEVSYVKHFA